MDYYDTLFPCREILEFVSRAWTHDDENPHNRAENREFALDINTNDGDQIFKRYIGAENPKSLRQELEKSDVKAVHLGGRWNVSVKWAKKNPSALTTGRELVFDLDLQDYSWLNVSKDEVNACDRAFKIVGFGIDLLRDMLHKTFGFKIFLAVYSGRRGAHLYVLDETAFVLTDEQRAAIASFFCANSRKGAQLSLDLIGILDSPNFDGLFQRCFDFIYTELCTADFFGFMDSEIFTDFVLDEMGLGEREQKQESSEFSTNAERNALRATLRRETQARHRLEVLMKWSIATSEKHASLQWIFKAFQNFVVSAIFPRIDIEVSKKQNHLLKAPYSAHAKTGRVAIPIIGLAQAFDPSTCPLVCNLEDDSKPDRKIFCDSVKRFGRFLKFLDSVHDGDGDAKDLEAETAGIITRTEAPEPKRGSAVCMSSVSVDTMAFDDEVAPADDGPATKKQRRAVYAALVKRSFYIQLDETGMEVEFFQQWSAIAQSVVDEFSSEQDIVLSNEKTHSAAAIANVATSEAERLTSPDAFRKLFSDNIFIGLDAIDKKSAERILSTIFNKGKSRRMPIPSEKSLESTALVADFARSTIAAMHKRPFLPISGKGKNICF